MGQDCCISLRPAENVNKGDIPEEEVIEKQSDKVKKANKGDSLLESKTVTVDPIGKHEYTLMFLHGMCDTAESFRKLMIHTWGLKVPDGFKIVFPQASEHMHPQFKLNETSWNNFKKWPQPDYPTIVDNDFLSDTFHQ